jgi:hypothetical protein
MPSINVFDRFGKVRNDFSEAELAGIDEDKRDAFEALRSASVDCEGAEAALADAVKRQAEAVAWLRQTQAWASALKPSALSLAREFQRAGNEERMRRAR